MYIYLPERNIAANFSSGSISSITKAINSQVSRELESVLNESYTTYFPHSDIIYNDQEVEQVAVNNSIVSPCASSIYSEFSVKFRAYIARVLGFDSNFRYTVYLQRLWEEEEADIFNGGGDKSQVEPVRLYAQHVPRADAGHDYMYIYSDIISPTQFGSQKVNI
ncbi:hypothetical protein E2C01_058076 [Portunus trituberculatus]|uniref:Uncharacterized protein n=1 Tax=Portunus trituberculatus TaxID=210409 RepID=A0A5B7H4B6_PORTR|nr:hypothetical protein [Portunus trituberculatus]